LRKWLDDGRAEVRMQRVLANIAEDWLEAERDPSFLLRGARLDQFVSWVAETELALTQTEQDFMVASLDEHMAQLAEEDARLEHEAALERRSRNFLRGLVAVMGIAAVIAVVLSIYAFNQQDIAQDSAATAQAEALARGTQQVIAEVAQGEAELQAGIAADNEADALAQKAIADERREQVLRQASVRLADDALGQIDLVHPERAVLLMLASLEEYPYTSQAENALARSVVEIANTQLFIDQGNVDWSAVSWSPSGDRIATAIYGKVSGAESLILLQDPSNEAENRLISMGDRCLDPANVVWSPDGERLITVPQYCDEAPNIWHAGTGELITSLESQTNQAAFSAAWSPDGESVATGSLDGAVRIWDAQSGALRSQIPAHSDYITRVAWSPSGDRLATASNDNTARIWEAETGTLLFDLSGHSDDVAGVAWSPDGGKIVTTSLDASALVWDAESGELSFPLKGHEDQVWDAAWSPDGNYIATDSRDGTARIWDAATGTELFRFRNNQAGESVLNSIDWSPQGEQLLTMGSIYNQIWNLPAQPPNLIGHLEGLKAAGWSPDGQRIATASLDGTARIWEAASGELLRTLDHAGAVEDLAWSPDSASLATADQGGTVRVWRVDSGASSEMPNADGYRFSSLGWAPDGKRIVAASERDLTGVIWEMDTGEQVLLDQGDLNCYLASPSWSPEGDRFVTGCVRREIKDTPARVWDAETGEDGEFIAVAYSEMMMHVLDAESSEVTARFSGHSDIIADLGWSPNNQRIVSADGGGFARVWDAASGEEVLSFKMTNTLNSVDWSPDGDYAILATLDAAPKIQRVWQSTESLVAYAAECCVWRELTPGERQQFGLPLQ
jgi:WD40 repeat protein